MSEIYNMPGHLIRRLNQISVSVFADRMSQEGYGFTPVQFAALSMVAQRPGVDQATLAGLIAYDRATLGGVVDRLEAKGLVRRTVSDTDRRARVLQLTKPGEDVLEKLRPVVADLQNRILTGLDDQERKHLVELLQKATVAGNELSRAPLLAVEPA